MKTQKINYRGWESMPAPLLELIIGRLRVVDRLRFAAVCKWWKNTFEEYPSELKQVPYGPPLLLVTKTFQGDKKILFDPWTKKELIVLQDEDFRNTMHLRSKEGWILLATCNYTLRNYACPCSPCILYNPITKRKLKLPKFDGYDPILLVSGDMIVYNGYPEIVVLLGKRSGSHSITLFICRPWDEAWEAHTYFCVYETYFFTVVVIERNVYVVDEYDCIIRFDLIQSEWTDPMGHKDWQVFRKCYYVGCDGEILQVYLRYKVWPEHKNSVSKFVFRRFNFCRYEWEELEEKDLQGKCWCVADFDSPGSGLSYATVGMEKVHCLSSAFDFKSYSLKDFDLTAPESSRLQKVFQGKPFAQASWVHI